MRQHCFPLCGGSCLSSETPICAAAPAVALLFRVETLLLPLLDMANTNLNNFAFLRALKKFPVTITPVDVLLQLQAATDCISRASLVSDSFILEATSALLPSIVLSANNILAYAATTALATLLEKAASVSAAATALNAAVLQAAAATSQ